MNILNTLISLYLAVGINSIVHASGVEVGNGGDATVCRDSEGKIETAELLDYYEARVNFGWNIKESGSRDQILQRFLERIAKINSYHKSKYQERTHQFFSESNFLKNVDLVDIPDSNHTTFPRGCKVEQLVIQKSDLLQGEKRYTINKDIWDHLDNVSQAGTIIHEIIYREKLGSNSRYVRFFNGKVAANNLKNLSLAALNELFYNLGIDRFIIPPSKAIISYKEFDASGRPVKLSIYAEGEFFEGVKLYGPFDVVYSKNEIRITPQEGVKTVLEVALPLTNKIVKANSVLLYTSGALKVLYRATENHLIFSNTIQRLINCVTGYFKYINEPIGFFPNGELRFCVTDNITFYHETDHYRANFYLEPYNYDLDKVFLNISDLGYVQSDIPIDADSDPETWGSPIRRAMRSFNSHGEFMVQGQWHLMKDVSTDSNGLPDNGKFINPTTLSVNSVSYNLKPDSHVNFFNGVLHSGQLNGPSTFIYDGHTFNFRSKHSCPMFTKSERGDYFILSFEGNNLTNAIVDKTTDFQLEGTTYNLKENDEVLLEWKDGNKLTKITTQTRKCN